MRATRVLLGALGVLLGLVGAWHLLRIGQAHPAKLVDVVVWLVAGVLLHDAVVAPLVVLVGVLAVPRLPLAGRAPAVAGLVVLLAVTLVAVPVIGRFGARADNPTLLDRPYAVLWLVFAAVVGAVVVAVVGVRAGLTSRRR
jgi:hypothetical protein